MQTEYQRLYYLKNILKVKECHKKYRLINKDKCSQQMKVYNAIPEIRDRRIKTSKAFRVGVRSKIYDILGDKCIKCGFSDKRALQFDHINGGGSEERRKFNSYQIMKFYSENPILAKQKLQVLCANCNWIKKHDEYENKCHR